MQKPLDQFNLYSLLNFNFINKCYIIITDFEITSFQFLSLVLILVYLINTESFNTISLIVSKVFTFIKNLVYNQLKLGGEFFYIYVISIFIVILFFNVVGLVPGGMCLTAQLIVPLTLSLSVFGGVVFYIITWFGIRHFVNLFIPAGIPKIMVPFLWCIEFISFLSRAISLSVRLFANMVAGHSLLHILINALILGFKMIKKMEVIFIFLLMIPLIIICAIYLLEFGIAFLQAYVFIVLTLIYLSDTIVKSH